MTTAFAPSYAADLARGPDLLGFENDALALASLIASTETKPPLSIGLFGDWGSGKSFFMRQIREFVAQIADNARGSETTVFHHSIVQIEFNAWHYAEGNLWASLVEHIFSNLRLRPDEDSDDAQLEKRRLELLQLLQVEQQQQQQATKRSEDARLAADKAREERTKKIEESVRLQLTKTSDWMSAVDDQTRRELGLSPETLQAIGKLRDHGRVYWELIGRIRTAFLLLWQRNRGLTLMFALALPLGIIALGMLANWIATKYLDLSKVKAFVTTVVAGATLLAGRLAPWIARVGDVAKTVEEKHRELEMRRQREAVAVDEEIAALSRRVEVADAEMSKADQRINDIRKEIEQATSARMFENFIEERAKSTDYRRHLGVLANIRRDFERMAHLIAKRQKDRTLTTVPDRIVLYVDDLDRCPAARVVKVLQAIHLLLAFPLFVVVVGVDARWIARALQLEYEDLLGAGDDGHDDSLGIEATPHDYLEKIFQVPFWIRAMSATDCANLIDGITNSADGPIRPIIERSGEAVQNDTNAQDPVSRENASTVETPKEEQPSAKPEPGFRQKPPPINDLNPFALRVLQPEIDLMKRLTPLLGRSPRAVKRFINCYRLIKIGLDPAGIGAFLTDPQGNLHYKPVMFLLATITGTPEFGEKVLDVLVNEEPKAIEAIALDGLLQLLANEFGTRFTDERQTIANTLAAEAAADEEAFRPTALRKAALIVRRYSFRAGYATAQRLRLEKRGRTRVRAEQEASTGLDVRRPEENSMSTSPKFPPAD